MVERESNVENVENVARFSEIQISLCSLVLVRDDHTTSRFKVTRTNERKYKNKKGKINKEQEMKMNDECVFDDTESCLVHAAMSPCQ
jgi:hypothetical protein